MRKIVITGATSMIGIALIQAALSDPAVEKIYAVVKPDTEKRNRIPSDLRIQVIPCDVTDYGRLASYISDECEVFYHLAWPRTDTYEENDVDIIWKCRNMQAVLEAVRAAADMGCKKYVGAGSQSEYGIVNAEKISPAMDCHPVRADGISHLAAGQLARMVSSRFGMSCIWMRIFSVYGRYDRPNSLISSTIAKLLRGEHCSFTPSEQMWDYLEADDIGRAFYLVGEKSVGHHIYCVGSGTARLLREYIETIRDLVAPDARLGFGELDYPPNPIMHLCADITDLSYDTGWKPAITFEEGIRRLVL